jgi:hypothetical protein
VFGIATVALASYLWRHQREIRETSAQLRQKAELQVRAVQYLPSDQCLYPHAKTAIGYALNPFMKRGTLWAPKDRPYAINSWGLRGGEIGPKPAGRKRVVLLGDSWFFGWLIGDDERLESHLRRVMKGAPVDFVTVAVPGWNVRSEAAFLESHMRELDPDAILWEICPNDTWMVGAVIPPGSLSWGFSPQNRELESNAFTQINNPLPLMPYAMDRHLENLAFMDGVRSRFGIPVLAAPVDIPPADWGFLTRRRGQSLPVRFVPRVFAGDRKGWISDVDSHPTRWMNERLAVGYATKLAAMGVLPPPDLDAGQQAVLREWESYNAARPSEEEIEAQIRSVMEQVPAGYETDEDFGRVAAGADREGTMGRRGLLYVHAAGRAPSPAVAIEVEVGAYAARFLRELTVTVRSFERDETAGTKAFSGAAQRVALRVPAPATSRYLVYEVEWRFNYDECPDPTRCSAARLLSVRSE